MLCGFMPFLVNLVAGAVLFAVHLLMLLRGQPAVIRPAVRMDLLVNVLFLMLKVRRLARS